MKIAPDSGKVMLRVWAAALWLLAMSAGWLGSDAFIDLNGDLSADKQVATASDSDDGLAPDLLTGFVQTDPDIATGPAIMALGLVLVFVPVLLALVRREVPLGRLPRQHAHSRAPPGALMAFVPRQGIPVPA